SGSSRRHFRHGTLLIILAEGIEDTATTEGGARLSKYNNRRQGDRDTLAVREAHRERTLGARAPGAHASGTGGPAGGIPGHAPARGQARRAPGSGPRLPHSPDRGCPVVARGHQALTRSGARP